MWFLLFADFSAESQQNISKYDDLWLALLAPLLPVNPSAIEPRLIRQRGLKHKVLCMCKSWRSAPNSQPREFNKAIKTSEILLSTAEAEVQQYDDQTCHENLDCRRRFYVCALAQLIYDGKCEIIKNYVRLPLHLLPLKIYLSQQNIFLFALKLCRCSGEAGSEKSVGVICFPPCPPSVFNFCLLVLFI